MTLLKFSDVSLAYGSTPLLDGVSWQIARGERVCIIGRNGTGKSSMLKLVRGTQALDDGEIECHGHPPQRPASMPGSAATQATATACQPANLSRWSE